jgi:hypothetical protein
MIKPLLASEIIKSAKFRIAGYIREVKSDTLLSIIRKEISDMIQYQGLMRGIYVAPLDLDRVDATFDPSRGPAGRLDVYFPKDLLDELDARLLNMQCYRCGKKYASRKTFEEHNLDECNLFILTDVHSS